MRVIALDAETTTHNKGHVFDSRNRLVCYSYACSTGAGAIQWSGDGESLQKLQELVDTNDLIIGFNIKFDLQWFVKEGLTYNPTKIWDCQLAHFIMTNQTHRFPSLNEVAEYWGLPVKPDVVKTEYWENKCSCYVSLVERIRSILQNNSALNAIVETMKGKTENVETLKNGHGKQLIQNVMQLLINAELPNLLLALTQRLNSTLQKSADDTVSQRLSTITSWQKQTVLFVEKWKNLSASTTITKQVELGTCCAEHVMLLLDILNEKNGWLKHHHTCTPTPVNTDAIPWPILEEYATHDAQVTHDIYLKQREALTGAKLMLFRLQCQDLSLLREMEANGIPFDEELCQVRAKELDDKISTLKTTLCNIYPSIPINWGSNDHLSAFLYGGVVQEDGKEFIGYYKSGQKAGQPKYKNVVIEHVLPRLYQPLKGTEMKKEGNYAVDEGTLRKLKGKKGVIEKLLELSKLEKLNGTYYKGLIKLREEMGWDKGILHGNFNQTTAQTGRLSSNKPNLQNMAADIQDVFISQYQ